MITIKNMADMLGISTTTVSNVIHGKTSEVSQKTVERVQKLLEEYDYVPNSSAISLTQNRSKIIGVALKSRKDKYENIIADPFHSELIGSVEAEIRQQGYFMMIYTSENIDEVIRNVLTWNVDGLLLVGMLHDDFIRIRSRYKKPIVLIDSYTPKDIMNYVNIGLEDEKGAYEMTRYLLEQGHRRIAFLADNMEGVDYIRYKGHKRALKDYGCRAREEDMLIIRPGMLERESSMEEIYERSREYTAFMCCSDYYAVIIMDYLIDRGVQIPEDLSITGFDDILLSRMVRPRLTTVRQDVTKKGRLSVEYLLDLVQEKKLPQQEVKLPVELVIRDSVKVFPPVSAAGTECSLNIRQEMDTVHKIRNCHEITFNLDKSK